MWDGVFAVGATVGLIAQQTGSSTARQGSTGVPRVVGAFK
jgi:hypothetical protein